MSDHKYHHLTPQTYMRGWKHKKSSVFIVQKGMDDLGESKSTEDIGGKDYYYSFRAGSLGLTGTESKRIFEPLKDYIVKINDKTIRDPLIMNKEFIEFNNWTIFHSDGQPLSNQEKQDLRARITSNHLTDIENKWDKKFEKQWNHIVELISKNVVDNPNTIFIKGIKRKELIRFMVSLEWRTKPYHPILQESIDLLLNMFGIDSELKSIKYEEDERVYPFLETAYDEQVHALLLSTYRQFLKDGGFMMDEVNSFIKNFTTVLLIAPDNKEFITSDNPVCRYYNMEGKIEYIFPITPKLACKLEKGGAQTEYLLRKPKASEIVDINHHLKDNCHKFYILREQNRSLYF